MTILKICIIDIWYTYCTYIIYTKKCKYMIHLANYDLNRSWRLGSWTCQCQKKSSRIQICPRLGLTREHGHLPIVWCVPRPLKAISILKCPLGRWSIIDSDSHRERMWKITTLQHCCRFIFSLSLSLVALKLCINSSKKNHQVRLIPAKKQHHTIAGNLHLFLPALEISGAMEKMT